MRQWLKCSALLSTINIQVPTIRQCTLDDVTDLSALAKRTFSETFIDTCTDDDLKEFVVENYDPVKISWEITNSHHIYFALSGQGVPIGYIQFSDSPVPFLLPMDVKRPLELSRLYVLKNQICNGIGRMLMDFFIAWAKAHSHDYLWLGVWEHNERAIAFYTKYGFRATGFTHSFPIGSTPQTDQWWYKRLN